MAIPKKIEAYLKKEKVAYEVVAHRTVFTAYDLAQTLKAKLESIAKTLLIKADKQFVLIVVPVSRRLDLTKLKKFLGVSKVSIAKEGDMVKYFKVKPGAMTAFGALHKVSVVADSTLAKARDIMVSAGSFTESLRMKSKDYLRSQEAKVGSFTTSAGLPQPKVAKAPKAKPKKTKKRRS